MKLLWTLGISILCLRTDLQAQKIMTGNHHLNTKQQSIVAISALTAKGDLPQLRNELNKGLEAGLSINEIKEILVQLYAYAGFPRSLNALQTLLTVLNERKQKGITDELGKEASPPSAGKDRLQLGTEIQTQLVGKPVAGALYDFSPLIDTFLKEHLFGDIFGRDNVNWQTRELATISALATLGGVENQLGSHYRVGLYNGLSELQLKELVTIIHVKIGRKEGTAANDVLQSALNAFGSKTGDNTRSENGADASVFLEGRQASQQNFTGTAWVSRLVKKDASATYSVGNIVFEAGARTNWHMHPGGQTLLITDGVGWYQEKGKSARAICEGDVVVIPANTIHWHGAAKNSSLAHIAITSLKGGSVKWLEPVAQEQYDALNK